MQIGELIQKAADREGSHVKLAERLGVTQQRVSEWKHGRRPCPAEVQGRIAQLAGEDAKEWVWRAVMGKAAAVLLAVGAAAMLCFGATGDARAAAAKRPNV